MKVQQKLTNFSASRCFYLVLAIFYFGVLPLIVLAENLPIDFSVSSIEEGGQNWEIFLNRDKVEALLLSDDKETLWVATSGGLEKRDVLTEELKKVYTNQSGLPYNWINTLASDAQNGIWMGTDEGFAHFSSDGIWQIWNESNSSLPDNRVKSLLADGEGGVWVGMSNGGLAHMKSDDTWEIFNEDNSDLPDNHVSSIASDGKGGIWIGTRGGGLAHMKSDDTWKVFNEDNSNLPYDYITCLLSDGQGGIWIGTSGYNRGIARQIRVIFFKKFPGTI